MLNRPSVFPTRGVRQQRVVIDPWSERVGGRPVPVVREIHADQRVVVGDECQLAQRALEESVSSVHAL